MALVLADRVRETTTSTGTGAVTLAGALTGFQAFSAAVGNSNTTYYVIAGQGTSEWEVGIGTYTSAGNTLSRDTVLSSSNAGSLVDFSVGTKDVWVDYAAGKAVTTDTLAYPPAIGGTTPAAATFTTLTATGQTSLGGVTDSESLRVLSVASATRYLTAQGSASGDATLSASGPSGSNVNLTFYSRGTGSVRFGTNSSITNEQFRVSNTASAVNYVQVTGAATTGIPVISSQGSDANIGLTSTSKGTGSLIFRTNNNAQTQFTITHTGSAVNYWQATGAAAGSSPVLSVVGSDTNIDLNLTPKGTGTVVANGPFTATGQTSLGGAVGSEGLRVIPTVSSTSWVEITGDAGLYPSVKANGPAAAVELRMSSKGTGSVGFFTNNVAQRQLNVSHTASAVNYVQVTGSATNNNVELSSQGSDASISMNYTAKNAGGHNFRQGGGTNFRVAYSETAPVNYPSASGGVSGNSARLYATGSDTNIALALLGKGTGAIDLAAGSSGVNISNGGTVTAITRTNQGANNYTSVPTCTISAPTTAGGVQAVIAPTVFNISATLGSGGTGYTVGDVLTVVGGTTAEPAMQFTVATVSAGVITSVSASRYASYSVTPTNPASVTGGTGSGATLNILYALSSVYTITNAGSGYVEQPTVSFSGGGGSGAAAYATVGSGTTVKSIGSTIQFATPSGIALSLYDASSTVANYVQMQGRAAGAPPLMSVAGSDTNINYLQSSKGTGQVSFYTNGFSQEQFRVSHTASAVNYVQVTGAATGGQLVISAQGSDANVPIAIAAKGNRSVSLVTNGVNSFVTQTPSSGVNYPQAVGSITGISPVFSVQGSDTNISQVFQSKGTGAIDLAAGSSGVNISNGGTVTAITRTATGSGYTSFPSVAISAPTTAGGVQAVATIGNMFNISATIQSGGTGYSVNDVLTVVGGTSSQAGQLTVTSVSGGVITGVSTTTFGTYSVLPTNPVSVTGGTGSSATFNLTYGVSATNLSITTAGSGYVEQPTVSFSGGGGSGAAAYASVGSGTTVKSVGSTMSFYTPFGESLRLLDGTASNYTTIASQGGGIQFGVAGSSANPSWGFLGKGSGNFYFTTGSSTGTVQFNITHTASAVNYVQVTGNATTGAPTLSTQGSDTNISMQYLAKGTGVHAFQTGSSFNQFRITATNSAVNYLAVTGGVAGSAPVMSSAGSDTNIDLNLTPKGTGTVVANGPFTSTGQTSLGGAAGSESLRVNSVASATRYISISGSTGTGNPNIIASAGSLVLSGGSTSGVIFYSSGYSLQQFSVAHTASAVNYVQVTGASTTNYPNITAQGSDTNIGLQFTSKGTGPLYFNTGGSGVAQFVVSNTASSVNYVQVTGAATGGGPTISTQGSDANVRLLLNAKGSSSGIDLTMNNARQVFIGTNGSAVNYLQLGGTATGVAPVISAQGSDTNIGLVLQPKGTGALQAQQTDSTATGGNARGANAVDWQTYTRTAASQVASGLASGVLGGARNTASGVVAVVVNGSDCTASGANAFIGGGGANTAQLNYSTVVGGYGNTASLYNFIGGGWVNSGTSGSVVTTQSATMNGTTAVTLSGSNASIKVGQYITGTSIATDTYVAAISGTSLTLSKVASGSSTSTLSFYTPHGVVVGGGNNQATGSYSFIGGGGDAGTAANRNTASGDWSFVGGGKQNTASGQGAVVCGGGFYSNSPPVGNTAGSDMAFIGGGGLNNANSFGTVICGGYNNNTNGTYSYIVGGTSITTKGIIGNFSFGANNPISGTQGTTQGSILLLGRQTTDATPTVLASNANAAGTNNQVILPNNSAYYFKGSVVAGVTGAGNTSSWSFEGTIKRGANAAATSLVGTPVLNLISQDAGASTWVVALTADTTNGGLAVTVTGQAATTIRWVAKIETTEMTY